MWKPILVIACGLLCLVVVATGTSQAKGGHGVRSSGNRGPAHYAKPHPIQTFQPMYVKPHPIHQHKHKHKHKPMGDFDGDLDVESPDGDEAAEAAEADDAELGEE